MLKRRLERLAGWVAVIACVSIAASIAMAPSWAAFLIGGCLIVAVGLLGRSLLRSS